MNIKIEKLKNYIKQVRGISFKPNEIITEKLPGYYPILKANNITEDGLDDKNLIFINNNRIKDEQLIKKGDILIAASSGSKKVIGKNVSFNSDYNGSFGAFCKVVRPINNIHSGYLHQFFKTPYYRNTIQRTVQGANINNLKTRDLDELVFPVPEKLEDQIRIANILSRAEALIAQRKESLQLLDELLKSTFLDMFGDPVRNEKGWEKDVFENLVANDCPLTYGIVQPGDEFPNGVPVIRPVDLTQTIVKRDGLKLIDPEISKKYKRTILKGNEILMCVRGTTGVISRSSDELIGCNVTRGITPIWFTQDYNTLFAFILLNTQAINHEIQKLTYGATLKQINLGDLRKIELIKPPLILQNQFAQIVEKVESIKTKYQESLQELENLYASLSQKAFKGELDLTRKEV